MKRRHRKPYSSAFILWLLFVVAVVSVLVTTVQLAPLYIFLIAVNVATFFLFGFDKWQSSRAGDRVP
ncbi:hypothetical protein HQ524_02875, partial [Candidatus Uhrbacteria bacterium]|nr:hypothetical protein [Candidatus Uhrbacteria bacterium]